MAGILCREIAQSQHNNVYYQLVNKTKDNSQKSEN